MAMVLMEFSMFPVGKGESLSPYVARSLDIIDKSGLDYQLTAMGTIVEGEIAQVLDLVQKCLEAMAADCARVSCSVKLDYRQGPGGRLSNKVKRVEQQLGRELRKT